jgi:valyl-tRNA synthetase
VPLLGRAVPILADATVDPAKGTGAVMCCTFGDSADVQWWREHRLPLIALLGRDGRLGEAGGPYAGLRLAEARARILADLEAGGHMVDSRPATQSVRVHERCGTPLEILETRQWFVRVLDAKEALLEAGRKIAWHPAHMRVRYEHWVQNLAWDWCISRQRFYGVPFPAWHCAACGATVLADEDQLPVDPLADAPPSACACGSTDLRPDEDVMDTWATSSLSPQIAGQLFAHPELYAKVFPMQLRPQAHDIIRTWSFYSIARSHLHFGQVPWETLMISGHALDPQGRKFSKSKGNAPTTPMALIDRHGADPVRYWACSAALGADQPLSEDQMRQGRRLTIKLWSVARLAAQHSEYGGGEIGEGRALPEPLPAGDRALISWLQALVAEVTARWEAYDYAGALEQTERFFWGTFCDQYLELVKGRLYDGDEAGKESARATIGLAFGTIVRLLAPVMPHICEEIHAGLFAGEGGSIHTAGWPTLDASLHDDAAEATGLALFAIAGAARRYKTGHSRSLGSPLGRLTIACDDKRLRAALQECAFDICRVTRAATLEWRETPTDDLQEASPSLWVGIEEDF